MAITPDLPRDIPDQTVQKQQGRSKASTIVSAVLRTTRQESSATIGRKAVQIADEGARISAIFSETYEGKEAKKATVEFVRKKLDEQLKVALEPISQDLAVVESILSGQESAVLTALEAALYEKLQPEIQALTDTEQTHLQAVSFKGLIRHKLGEYAIKHKVLTREQVQLLRGYEQTLKLVNALQSGTNADLDQVLSLCKKMDVLSAHIPLLAGCDCTLKNSQLLEEVGKFLLDEIGRKLQKDLPVHSLSDQQLDLLLQWGRLLEVIALKSDSSNLFAKSVGEALHEYRVSKEYPSMHKVEELLALEYKKNDERPFCLAHLRAFTLIGDYLLATKPSELGGMSEFDRKFLAQFLVHSAGSKELFKRMQRSQTQEESSLLPADVVQWYSQLTGYGIGKERFALVGNKLDYLMQALINERMSPEHAKLSQDDFGIAFRATVLYEVLEHFLDLGLMQVNDDLMKLAQECATIRTHFIAFEKILQQQCKEQAIYQSGDILTTRLRAFSALGSRGIGTEDWLMEHFITEKSHGACLYISQEDEALMVSHVMQKYQNDMFTLATACISDSWRLSADTLLKMDDETRTLLEGLFGKEKVQEQVNRLYQVACRHIHEDLQSNFATIRNSRKRQKAAGMADFTFSGHKRKDARTSFQSLYDEFMQPMKENKEMICSEFVVKAIIVSLIELDHMLIEALKQKLGPDDERIVTLGQKQQNEELMFIDMPISTKERLSRVHPGRLIELLQKPGAITPIKPAGILHHIMQKSAFD